MSYATARGSRHSMEATPGPFVADQHMQTDAGVAAGTSDEPQEPTLLQKAAGAASAVAQGAADLAAGAYAAAVGTSATTSTPEGEEEGQAAAADRSSIGTTAIPDLKGGNAAGPLDAAGLQRRTATGDRTGAETTTNPTTAPAAVPPALAGTPAPTGQGYVPVAGAVAPTATPAPRPSGDLEARHVVAERLKGLEAGAGVTAAEAVRHAPATPEREQRGSTGRRQGGTEEDWLSQMVERLWPYLRQAIEKLAWEMLPDILEASEPTWIHDINLKKFHLGEKEPDIFDIRVWMDDNDVMDDCFLEFGFEWHSKQDVELEIQVLPGSMDKAWIPNFLEDKLKGALTFSVGVEDAMLKGRVRLTLRPLLTRVPVIGAVQVALTEQPEFDFDITLGNNSSVPLEPALKNFIKQTLQDTVFQSYVSPEHYFLQIDPEAADIECPTGVLLLKVIEATKVPKMDLFSRSSPFVEFFVRNSKRMVTTTKSPTKHPRWNESFELPVHVPEHQELRMVLYDYDWASANDEIGRAVLKLSDLQPGQPSDLWLDIVSEGDKDMAEQKGELGKRDRAKIAAARPFLKGSTKNCQLHIEATYQPFTDAEEQLIKRGQRDGLQKLFDSPEGREISSHLRNLLMSGTLQVKVPRADDLPVSSFIGRPSVKAVVRCGGEEKELPAVKASKHRSVQFDQPVQLDLGPKQTQDSKTTVTIELQGTGLLGGSSVGTVSVPLQDVIKHRTLEKGYRLEGSSKGHVQLELVWQPVFGNMK
ncbi:hypothetical protein D9Q98_001226 [Chlorella vulgaris]|uniref:Uncharacterized protein n=1 Tax=Chlorella vulgaris TaxID=3077 RepID=A0A9D4U0R5_CHLVU|nr:hypothetical protein D9Q98_001226 [Chlorella vulgaris]